MDSKLKVHEAQYYTEITEIIEKNIIKKLCTIVMYDVVYNTFIHS